MQSLARRELEEGASDASAPEVLAENRFLAGRDGVEARLIDPRRRRLVPVREQVGSLVASCRPHAAALGCSDELEHVHALATSNGAERQRRRARATGGATRLTAWLADRFAAPSSVPLTAVPQG